MRALQRGNEEEMGRLLSEARHALSQGSYTESLRKADLMLAADPGRVDARLVRARSLMNTFGRRNEAVAEAILADDPDDWAAHAVIVAAGGAGRDREPHVAAVERLAPDTSEALTLRASITDSPEEALALLDRALNLDPGNADALESRAWRQMALKDFQAALDNADRLLVARPRSVEGRVLRALAYVQLKDFDAAKQEVDKAINADPEASVSYSLRAGWHAEYRGDVHSAKADMATAMKLDPDNIEYLQTMAGVLTNLGSYEEARVHVERLLELDPTNPRGHGILVDMYQAQGQDDEARGVLANLEQMAGEFSDPKWVECPDHYDGERYEMLARGVVDYDSRDANNQYGYGSVLTRNGRYEQARQALEKWQALSTRDTSPYGHFELAMIYSELGDRAAARNAYDHGVSIIDKYAPKHTGWTLRKAKAAKILGI